MSRGPETGKAVEVFYSYSHVDEDLRLQLEKHLASLQRQGVITGWYDRKITGGTEFKTEINSHLKSARIILLLVSVDFMASEYCYDIEMTQALERHKDGEARVIPIILRPVKWKNAPFGTLQVLPKDGKPVISWPSLDDAFLNVAEGIELAVKEMAMNEPTHNPSAPVATAPMRVFLSYKRNTTPDEDILKLLEKDLSGNNFEVFIDRHLMIGVGWAREIELNVRTADAVIPILSADSIKSEMLAFEVDTAYQMAQQNHGKPRLLPVRVNYEGPLPASLAKALGGLQYALWRDPKDNRDLVEMLIASLRNPVREQGYASEPGGAIALDASYYIVRPTDKEFATAISNRDFIVLVKGARQMGKTSLLLRGLEKAGDHSLITDLQMLNESDLGSIDDFYKGLGSMIADKLKLDTYPEDVWRKGRGANVNFLLYLQRQVLDKIEGRLIWGLDEVDRLFTRPYANEVFGMFRSWFNESRRDPKGWSQKLSIVIVYATEPHLFITDLNQSPFNVGTRLELQDFSPDQVAEFNRCYMPPPLKSEAELETFHGLLNGHPYLVHRGLHEIAKNDEMNLERFISQAHKDEGVYGDHLRRLLVLLAQDSLLYDVVREVLQEKPCANPDSFYRLRSAGILAGDSWMDAKPRCELYKKFLSHHLLTGNLQSGNS